MSDMESNTQLSTGLPGLDRVLEGILPGDNVVWHVGDIEDYGAFVEPFVQHALKTKQKLIYFQFARGKPLIESAENLEVHHLRPGDGFEQFITHVHNVIRKNGQGGCYVFDSLSELALDCYSDRMIGNFFMLTCPYLRKLETLAYFAVIRNYHSLHAAAPIADTTQLLIDVYRHDDALYVQPKKVDGRFSDSIYLLHKWNEDRFEPVAQSAHVAEILNSSPWLGLEYTRYRMGVWNRVFMEAEEILKAHNRGECPDDKVKEVFHHLLWMAFSRDKRMLRLAKKYLTLAEVLQLRKRMIGTGYIGGKAAGMLLSRAILRTKSPYWANVLEAHDSFYIGSEVFYTYLVLNDCWWVRNKQKNPDTFLDFTDEARNRILNGEFPDYILKRFEDMLDYFGQSPIVVRSSSLLEDNFGNTFAGKYESLFCVNQKSREHRLDIFQRAVKSIYASSMSREALTYRAQRGLLDTDEQMALLVQRVSGGRYGNYFYPQIAGVGISFNPFVWSDAIDPEDGVMRLVFGLGTRAVERNDDDYTRVVALSAPLLRPESGEDEIRRFTQRKVDLLDIRESRPVTKPFTDVIDESPGLPQNEFICPDQALSFITRGSESGRNYHVLSLDDLLSKSNVVPDIKDMLAALQHGYQHPVDIEFTANRSEHGDWKINLLQCRPFQIKGAIPAPHPPQDLSEDDIVLKAYGAVVGSGLAQTVDRIVYVVPSIYGQLPERDRYSIARLIGKLTHLKESRPPSSMMLIGPGRWGTTTPTLGVPVSFGEINTISILCEVVAMRDDLIPDVSLGTHFFNNLVEMEILYFALFPHKQGNFIREEILESMPNCLATLVPEAAKLEHAVRVIDTKRMEDGRKIRFLADSLKRSAICYLDGGISSNE